MLGSFLLDFYTEVEFGNVSENRQTILSSANESTPIPLFSPLNSYSLTHSLSIFFSLSLFYFTFYMTLKIGATVLFHVTRKSRSAPYLSIRDCFCVQRHKITCQIWLSTLDIRAVVQLIDMYNQRYPFIINCYSVNNTRVLVQLSAAGYVDDEHVECTDMERVMKKRFRFR